VTHDELLQAINDKLAYYTNNNFGASGFAVALRSIVELHKPLSGWEDGVEVENHHCSCDEWDEYDAGYPCETIQAIEKELGN
jgi:hypothetical protein